MIKIRVPSPAVPPGGRCCGGSVLPAHAAAAARVFVSPRVALTRPVVAPAWPRGRHAACTAHADTTHTRVYTAGYAARATGMRAAIIRPPEVREVGYAGILDFILSNLPPFKVLEIPSSSCLF